MLSNKRIKMRIAENRSCDLKILFFAEMKLSPTMTATVILCFVAWMVCVAVGADEVLASKLFFFCFITRYAGKGQRVFLNAF